jgi:hypothetical protein
VSPSITPVSPFQPIIIMPFPSMLPWVTPYDPPFVQPTMTPFAMPATWRCQQVVRWRRRHGTCRSTGRALTNANRFSAASVSDRSRTAARRIRVRTTASRGIPRPVYASARR